MILDAFGQTLKAGINEILKKYAFLGTLFSKFVYYILLSDLCGSRGCIYRIGGRPFAVVLGF
jgi:hypothetical protein